MRQEADIRAVLAIGRLTHVHPSVDEVGADYDDDSMVKPPVVAVADGANVVSSLLTNGMHAPAIDLDVPVILLPSSTPGHFHLYIDHELDWADYQRLLGVLHDVGLVEDGFWRSALRRGTTLLRLPHVSKPT